MIDHCGTVTEEGNAVCIPGSCSCSQEQTQAEPALEPELVVSQNEIQQPGRWLTVRSGLLFGIACLTSPCCTPLIVPLVLAFLAGTPAALWLSARLGWVYGVLTIVSILSFVLGIRWTLKKQDAARRNPNDKPIHLSMQETNRL